MIDRLNFIESTFRVKSETKPIPIFTGDKIKKVVFLQVGQIYWIEPGFGLTGELRRRRGWGWERRWEGQHGSRGRRWVRVHRLGVDARTAGPRLKLGRCRLVDLLKNSGWEKKSRKIEILRRTFSDWIKELEGNEKLKSNERNKFMENFDQKLSHGCDSPAFFLKSKWL